MADENKDNTPLPQYDRGKCKTELGFFQTLFRLKEVDKQGAIPAIVRSYNRKTGIATVQPIVTYVVDTKEGEKLIPRGTYDVSVIRFAHGGFVIDAPLFAGDTGWLIAADRNAKDAKEANSKILNADQDDENPSNEGFKRPTDDSLRSFSWGFFIPDTWGDTELTKNDGLVVSGIVKDPQVAAPGSSVVHDFQRGGLKEVIGIERAGLLDQTRKSVGCKVIVLGTDRQRFPVTG